MRRDPETVAAYRRLISEINADAAEFVGGMSDELVIENVERFVEMELTPQLRDELLAATDSAPDTPAGTEP